MTKDEQKAELKRISLEFSALVRKAEGMFYTDHGYHPPAMIQARLRFEEASMWLTMGIDTIDY